MMREWANVISIPSRVGELLAQDARHDGCVKLTLVEFEPLVRDNKLTFFPEYTDHGIDHIEGVMRTAEALIRDEAWPVLTPADAMGLVLACLLHDVAMHLTLDGFVALVIPDTEWHVVAELGDRPWPELWAEFSLEAKRFDDRKLKNLFGSTDLVGHLS